MPGEKAVIMVGPGGVEGKGGMGRFLKYLVATLSADASPVDVRVVDSYGPGPILRMPFHAAAGLLQVAGAIRRGEVGIVHLHMADWGSVWRKGAYALVASALGAEVVIHLHGANYVETCMAMPRWALSLHRRVLRRASRIMVIGSYWRDFVLNQLGMDPAKVILMHNGAPAAPALADRSPPAQRPGGDLRVVTLGRLSERKGTPTLLHALAVLRDAGVPVTAQLAGDGDIDGNRQLADRLGLTKTTTFRGWVAEAEAEALLDWADVFVLPSRHVGLPVAIIEAMGRGAVVVSTPVGAIPDAITDGETGLLVPPDDPTALSRALIRLAHDPDLVTRLRCKARARYLDMFTIEAAARKIKAVYQEIL
jgi:glycosyltransferase involved in cell wall biosynthesis